MKKIDYRREWKERYQPSASVVSVVELPAANFLMMDGRGDPNTSPEFAAAVEVLFAVSYTVKFMVKRGALAVDYAVMPLEGLWWADDMNHFADDKSLWFWTAMILQPEFITPELVQSASDEVRRKKKLSALNRLRFESFNEGLCAQIMHVGPFSEEGPTVAKVHQFIEQRGGALRGKHHEIYLSDLRRAAPAKWRTVVRQPFTEKS
jgi:hypothetical protein